jgi:putative flippase GtrA
MSDRTRRLIAEAGRFMVVGGAATTVAFVLFNLAVHGPGSTNLLRDHPVSAYVLANSVGMAVSYHLSRYWVFRHRPPRHADGGLTAYVVINVVTMTIPVTCLILSRHALGLADPISDNVSANAIGLLLGQAARFYLFRRFVFHRPISLVEVYDEPDPVVAPSGVRRARDAATTVPAPGSAPGAAGG